MVAGQKIFNAVFLNWAAQKAQALCYALRSLWGIGRHTSFKADDDNSILCYNRFAGDRGRFGKFFSNQTAASDGVAKGSVGCAERVYLFFNQRSNGVSRIMADRPSPQYIQPNSG